jgi:hypothetical protein
MSITYWKNTMTMRLLRSFFAALVLVLAVMFPIGNLFGQQSTTELPNLYPRLSDFSITQESFDREDDSVLDECIEPGDHRLLRFSVSVANNGLVDAYIGNPEDNPSYFEWSETHGHYHIARFNEYRLLDGRGREIVKGFKQGFCMVDIEPLNPRDPAPSNGYDCSNQGISVGWADVYDSSLPCQFVELKGVDDGVYTLEIRTNAHHVVPEITSADNTLRVRLRIEGDEVTQIR